ncbi:beta-ketoacyl synthase N-terminal-like domain-containing protein [Pseudanabaena minima]|uniref:type I polyketide synthase n=1 Tax=Pseudanabaena minima TaxID=890415 RepID=UPI003DA97282
MKEPIAIIGIGCRFPQANSVKAFWQLLRDGVDAIAPMPSDRRQLYPFNSFDDAALEAINGRWGGFLDGIDQFDAEFFGISPSEAVALDPQQRLLLEVSWIALEDAALTLEQVAGSQTGVFIGMAANGYEALLQGGKAQTAYTSLGTSNAIAANRISQYFDLQGASLAINTTCSSSLVAVDLACHSLWSSESNLALAGGVNIFANLGISPKSSELLSPTHRCRSFSAAADGYVRSEGVGIIVLKPLSEALANRDRIYAVIRGSAVNHNGRGNGLTAPNLQAQESLLRRVYKNAGIEPQAIHYLEAHATGTMMGDAVEMKAIERVFNSSSSEDSAKKICQIGTVKTNIGHTETASGIAGLFKVALALHHRQIPPHLHFEQPSPYIEFEKLSFQVPTILTPLPLEGSLYAGVSAFGMGGTNAHVILESAPQVSISLPNLSITYAYHVLILSAKTEQALRQMAVNYHDFLKEQSEVTITQVCATSMRRTQFNYRLAIVVKASKNEIDDLQQNLSAYISDHSSSQVFSGKVNLKKYKKQSLHTILKNEEPLISKLSQNYPQHTLEQIIFGVGSFPELDPNTHNLLRDRILDLWVNGVKVDWSSLYVSSNLTPISLPSYPFERQSFWVQPSSQSNTSESAPVAEIPITRPPKTKSARDLESNFVAPRDRTEKKLVEIWEKVFDIKPIGIHDNFFDIGGTSTIAVNLFAKIEQSFKCHLSLVVVFQCPTIAQLAQMLSQLNQQEQLEQTAAWSTLVPIRPTGIHPPLFCVSGIHGSVLIYADLAKHLGADQPFYGLQPKGIDGIHQPLTSIEEIAAYYIQVVQTVQPKGPYFLGGFSLGSHVVWEMSQQLRKQGEKVALLALFDGKIRSINTVRQPFRKRIFIHYQSFREMGFTYLSQKFPAWQEWLIGRYQYWTKRIIRRFYQRMRWKLPIYLRQSAIEESLEKAGKEALKNYVMKVYPDKVTLFRADTQEADQGVGFVPLDWDLGWSNLAAGGLDIQTISGDHMSMFHEPQVQVLAQKLHECLHRARQAQR